MKIKYNIRKDMVDGVDMHLSPVEFLVIHAILKEAFEDSTDAGETIILDGIIGEIETQLEDELIKGGIDYDD